MADQASTGADDPPDGGGGKKEISNEQLKAYIHKARAKIRKLEEENKSLIANAGGKQPTSDAGEGRLGCA